MAAETPSNNYWWQYGRVSNQEVKGAIEEGALNADGILDLLNEDDVTDDKGKKEAVKKEEPKEVEIKEDKEEDESEIELEDEPDEEVEPEDLDVDIIAPVSFKKIEAAYPDIDKKFPQLKAAYYKSQQYSEVFPTLDDAKEAAEAKTNLDKFSADILSGNLEPLFTTVKQNAPNSLRKIADTLITQLGKADENIALHVVGNVIKHSLSKAARDGVASKDEDLQAAAAIINKYLFGSTEITSPTKLAKEETKEEDEFTKERQQFELERYQTVLNTLQGRVDNSIKATIDANIDPRNSMTAYVKKNAVKDAFDRTEKAISSDKAFQKVLDNLWRSAKDAKYSSPSLEKIRSAYLNKAKTVLRDAIRGSRNEALKGSSGNEEVRPERKGPLPAHRSSGSSNNPGKAKEIPKGMSTKDFIMSD